MRHRIQPLHGDYHEIPHRQSRKRRRSYTRYDAILTLLFGVCLASVFLLLLLLVYFLPQNHKQSINQLTLENVLPFDLENATTIKQKLVHPVELSQLNEITISSIASKTHIMHTYKGIHSTNQDRAVMIPSYCNMQQRLLDTQDFFIGLFDGHDDKGHEIAQFALDEIPFRICNQIQNIKTLSNEKMKQIVSDAFISVDRDAPRIAGGCTGMAIIKLGSKLYMANTGDSTQFIAVYHPKHGQLDQSKSIHNQKYIHNLTRSPDNQLQLQGTVSIYYENKKHKAHYPQEKSRIESLKGRIHIPPKNPMGSRVIVRSSIHGEDVGLAMSRSIGDFEWTGFGVIPDPDVQIVDLDKFSQNLSDDDRVFVVLGSDGLFDARRVEFVAKHLAYGFFEQKVIGKDSFSKLVADVGKKLIHMASPLNPNWYRDDITFVAKVVDL